MVIYNLAAALLTLSIVGLPKPSPTIDLISMPIETSHSLIDALRTCGLFPPKELEGILRELSSLGDDASTLMRHLLHREWLTLYQLRKLVHGKTAELRLGTYILTEKVGEGGMGKVYRARRMDDVQAVALKIIRPILLANPMIRKRYEREVTAALALKHTNIVSVFDAGEVDGRHYIAMEFVDGIDLSRLVKEVRALEIAEACEYGRQAALGMHYAHQAGFVHRDIKPSNIVVAGERHILGSTGPAIVKILDMGLIRSVGFTTAGEGSESNDLTRAGTVVGTPDYMAPEQAKNSSTVDHRADLYSLGCTLYYLLAGRPPFPEGNAIEKIIKHQLEAPLPLQALRPEVPTEVAEVIAKLMAKSPVDRFPTALEAADALAPLARDLLGLISPPRQSGTFRVVSEADDRSERAAVTPVLFNASDNTPTPATRTRRSRRDRKRESLSSLHEPPSSEQTPVSKPQATVCPSASFWSCNLGNAIGLGLALIAVAIAIWIAATR
jgi:serine/threonine-protein kinase